MLKQTLQLQSVLQAKQVAAKQTDGQFTNHHMKLKAK